MGTKLLNAKLKDTGDYEIREMVYWGFRIVLDGKKS